MENSESNVVTLRVDRSSSMQDAAESLRLLTAFMQLPADRRADLVDAIEREVLTLPPPLVR